VRALSWNVHGFIGRSGRPNPDAVIAAVLEFDADLLALQEIDERRLGADGEPAFARLRRELGRHGAEARTIRTQDGDYGHALLSRWPVTDVALLDLSVLKREPRVAISARVEAPGGSIRVVAAHLGLSARERRQQVGWLRQHLGDVGEDSAIVMGDFNEWRRRGIATRSLCPPFEPAAAQPSFPAGYPVLALDRIWCRTPLSVVAAGSVDTYRHLSDHLPIYADLSFGPASASAGAGRVPGH
jgi:endonuclease/exonuclease/phosphatase family metal-dependent hydrolase